MMFTPFGVNMRNCDFRLSPKPRFTSKRVIHTEFLY